MDLEPVEPGSLPDPAPVRRRPRWVAAGVASAVAVFAGVGIVITGDGDQPGAVQTATAPDDGNATPVEVSDESTSTTGTTDTTAGTEASTSSTANSTSVTTRRVAPTSTTNAPTVTTVSPPAQGTVLTADRAGIWSLDLASGTLRRITDDAPFDVAGDVVLTSRGRKVFATPIDGGDTILRYDAPSQGNPQFSSGATFDPSREAITSIDAGVDGSVVAGIFGPVVGADGKDVAQNGNYFLLNPSGQRVQTHYIQRDFAWSADGTKLAAATYVSSPPPSPSMTPTTFTQPRTALVVLRPDGSALHGPVDSPETQALPGLSWSGDGRSVIWQNSSTGAPNRYDIGTGRFTVLPGKFQSLAIGLDGRILTTRLVPPEHYTAVDFMDPVTGALTPFLPRGDYPLWSPDGKSVVVAVIPPPYYSVTPHPLTVVDAGGTARFTVTIPDHLAFGQLPSHGPGYNRPQWSVSGRYLVFAAYPR